MHAAQRRQVEQHQDVSQGQVCLPPRRQRQQRDPPRGSSVVQVGGGRGGCYASGSQAPPPTPPMPMPTSMCPATHPGSTELKFILSGSTLDETLEWAVALERLDVPSSFDPVEWPASLSGRVALALALALARAPARAPAPAAAAAAAPALTLDLTPNPSPSP